MQVVFLQNYFMKSFYFNRRHFIKGLGATALLLPIPLAQSCRQQSVYNGVLPREKQKILHQTLNLIFPPTENSPNIEQINVEFHINNYLTDPLIDPDEQTFLIHGIQWLDESAHEDFSKSYLDLNQSQQIKQIEHILNTSWGESWLSKLLTLTFEALLLDPLYRVNTNEIGWQWLHHQPGSPRPKPKIAYPEILNRKREQMIITNLNQL